MQDERALSRFTPLIMRSIFDTRLTSFCHNPATLWYTLISQVTQTPPCRLIQYP